MSHSLMDNSQMSYVFSRNNLKHACAARMCMPRGNGSDHGTVSLDHHLHSTHHSVQLSVVFLLLDGSLFWFLDCR